jgi:hypothetical protein
MTVAVLKADLGAEPFLHATHPAPLPATLCASVLTWMETIAPWKLRIASFYEQWELHLEPGILPVELRPVLAAETIDHLRSVIWHR